MSGKPGYVGRAVKEIRQARKMTQSKLAAACGMELQSIQNIESDRRGVSPKSASDIATNLDVPVTYLYLLADESSDQLVKEFQVLARQTLGIESRVAAC